MSAATVAPTEREFVARAALAEVYSGATLTEARALLDALEDRGFALTPHKETR